MTSQVFRPLLFLDVDDPLIPFGGTHREYPVRHRHGNPSWHG